MTVMFVTKRAWVWKPLAGTTYSNSLRKTPSVAAQRSRRTEGVGTPQNCLFAEHNEAQRGHRGRASN